jgi:uncharacterized transporter YbjL
MFDTVIQGIVAQLTPMLASMLVIVVVFGVVLLRVRNRFVRQLGGYAAALVWVGWFVNYYKVV